jgi:AcrR family transcriptional regulator
MWAVRPPTLSRLPVDIRSAYVILYDTTTDDMSIPNLSPPFPSLTERQSELTRGLILDAALAALEAEPTSNLTMRLVAKRAAISERTVFRYFATREDLLDAVVEAFQTRLELPPTPRKLEDLLGYPSALYKRFEANANLNKASLLSEISQRLRLDKSRLMAVRKIVDRIAPQSPERMRKIAAANIRFYLAASSWFYFRFVFGFSLEDSIACAETAICQSLAGLGLEIPESDSRN